LPPVGPVSSTTSSTPSGSTALTTGPANTPPPALCFAPRGPRTRYSMLQRQRRVAWTAVLKPRVIQRSSPGGQSKTSTST
jgi:flavin reductase (DIM6/NTAB) family NADH-FMN oxidoreductase RutF